MPSVKVKKITKAAVFAGKAEKTQGLSRGNGLTKDQLVMNKRGKVVDKAMSEKAKEKFSGSDLEKWTKAVTKAKEDLGLTGWQDLEGTVDNKLYNLARDYYEEYKKVV